MTFELISVSRKDMESNNNPGTTTTSNRMSWKVTEHHKTQRSHANGTTMGRFPQLTPVRLSPQVPDHMTVSKCDT